MDHSPASRLRTRTRQPPRAAGSKVDDYQIVGLLLAALFAGQHTSSITSTWTLLNTLHHPEVYDRVMAENVKYFGTAPNDRSGFQFDALMKMDYLHNVVKEGLRQAPPLIMLMRKTHVDFAVGDVVVPKGHLVFTSPAVSMNLPTSSPDCCFPNPEKFDPDRYVRGEDKAKSFAFNAFGGGRHGCLGEQFGYLQVKTIVSLVLRQFEITPLSPLPKPNYAAMVVGPCKPTNIRYKRRAVPLPAEGPFTVPKL